MKSLSRLAALGALLPALVLAKPEAGDSAHYRTVRDRVGEGGQVFVYVDVDGYFTELGRDLTTSVAAIVGDEPSLAGWKQDYAAVAAELGLAQVKAVGLSARPLGNGLFANRMFLYAPEGRRGLLQVLGGAAHPFNSARLAPADADLFVEAELDLAALTDVSLKIAKRIDPGLETDRMAGIASLFSLTKFKGRLTAVVRLADEKAPVLDLGIRHDVLIASDSAGPQLLALLQMGVLELKMTKREGERTFYTAGEKAEGLTASVVAAVEGEQLYLASSEKFLRECLDRKSGLPQAPAFTRALGATSKEGNSLLYATPRLFATLHGLLVEQAEAGSHDKFVQGALQLLAKLDQVKSPVVSVAANLPDGLLIQAQSPTSLRESLPVLGLATPDLAGNILRVALPAYVAELHAKALVARNAEKIRGNLATIAAAAPGYFAAHADAEQVAFPQLVETTPALARIAAVAGESYAEVIVHRNRDDVELSLETGDTVTYARPLTDDERQRIERNLALYDEAAALYLAAHPEADSMSHYQAIETESGLAETPPTVVGEDYDFEVARGATVIEVRTPGGTTITYQRVPGLRWTALKRRAQQTAAIRENLALIYSIATDYLAAHPDESYVSGSELFGEEKERPELRAIAGEEYGNVRVTRLRAGTSVTVPGLGEITYEAPVARADVAAIQSNLCKLAAAAMTYFVQHPQENLVVVGELVGAGLPQADLPKPVCGEDYLGLVIVRGAPALTIALPTGQKVTLEKP